MRVFAGKVIVRVAVPEATVTVGGEAGLLGMRHVSITELRASGETILSVCTYTVVVLSGAVAVIV